MNSNDRESSLKDIGYGLLLSCGSLLAAIILLMIAYELAFSLNIDGLIDFLYLLHPINQGLGDHLNFGSTLLFTISSALLVCAFLIPRFRRLITHKTPWIIAGCAGMAAGVVMLVDMRMNIDYHLYESTGTVLIVQGLIIIAGFLFQWLSNKR